MGIFNRKEKENIESNILTEGANANNYVISGLGAYNFVRGLRRVAVDNFDNDYMYDRMLDDAIIGAAVDMYIEDALQVDPLKKEMFWVETDNTDDPIEAKLSAGLADELNRFLKDDLRLPKELKSITRRLIQYGQVVGKLDFIDKLEDDRLKLTDKNKEDFTNLTDSIKDYNSEEGREVLKECHYDMDTEPLTYKKLMEDYKIKEGTILKEDSIINGKSVKRLMRGRWYFQKIGQGTSIWELQGKGKVIAYLDIHYPDKLMRADNLVCFSNKTGKHLINFEVGPYNEVEEKKEYYTLEQGESYLETARVAWQVLSALEDILMLTRMTRSILYRIFSVEVANKDNKQTSDILNNLKNRIKTDETINVKEQIYNTDLRQVPLGDSIFIPVRNGVGAIDIKTVGGDVNLKDAIDLDYFKDKLFAALRIPKAFLGFGDDSTGGMINTSLTRMDIRYARTIKGIQNILSEGIKDLCLKYLKMTRPANTLEELPDFKIVFTSVNTQEDNERNESRKTQVETLQKVVEAFGDLGVSVPDVPELRDELIKEWLGTSYLDIIKKAEKEGIDIDKNVDETNDHSFGDSTSSFDTDTDFGANLEPNKEQTTEETGNQESSEEFDQEELNLGTDFEEPKTLEAPAPVGRELK